MQRLVSALLLACAIFITPSYQQNPVLVQGLQNQTVNAGGFAYFYAVFDRAFSAQVQWFQNGVLQQQGGSLQISQTTTSTRDLSINPVAPSDAGLYRVVVTVNGQTISTQAYLNVPGGTITQQLSDQTVSAGSTVVIEFQLSLVVPTSEITWYRNAAIVTNTARYTISSSGTAQRLTITNVQTTDAGVFTAQYGQQSTAMQLQVVNTAAINGNWGAWQVTINPPCGITCGSTTSVFQTRSRFCNNPSPSNGGASCPGSASDNVQKTCVFTTCPGPINGNWGAWQVTVDPSCGITCGSTNAVFQTRSRSCNNPSPSNGGVSCPGSSVDSVQKTCVFASCPGPTNGNWGPWQVAVDPSCGITCGSTNAVFQTRSRECNNPPPSNGGVSCPGSATDNVQKTCVFASCQGVTLLTPLQDEVVNEGAQVVFYLFISEPGLTGNWYKDNILIPTNTTNLFTYTSGQYHYLVLFQAVLSDAGLYRFDIAGLTSQATLTVNPSGVVNGNWGQWQVTSDPSCVITCGSTSSVFQTRTRQCNSPPPSNGGVTCPGAATDSVQKTCSFSPCPSTLVITVPAQSTAPTTGSTAVFTVQLNQVNVFNGIWVKDTVQLFNSTKTLISTNGFSQQLVVTNVQAQDVGFYSYIVGNQRTNATLTLNVPINGNWGAWQVTIDPSCGITCGSTNAVFQTRFRSCDNPPPSNGGVTCPGSATGTVQKTCIFASCPGPINGNWGAWQVTIDPFCGITCGSTNAVFQSRSRACNNPSPSNGGVPCPGSSFDTLQKTCVFASCPVVTQDLCSTASFSNGNGYRYHPTDCDKYIQCYYNPNGNVVGVYRSCPFGYYWDQNTLRCGESWTVNCPLEKCSGDCTAHYPLSGSCRSYYECERGVSVAKCCVAGFMYQEGQGCRPNFFCRDTCPTPCAERDVCNKRPNWDNDISTYNISVGLLGWMPAQCKSGSYFDVADCGCRTLNFSCNADYNIPFSSQLNLIASYITAENIPVSGGVATFDQTSSLFANITKPTSTPNCPIVIQFRYRETTTVVGRRVLVSASNCNKEGSANNLVIAVDDEAINFEVMSWYGNVVRMPISTSGYSRYTWRTVTLMYNGFEMIASVETDNAKYYARTFASESTLLECGLTIGGDGTTISSSKFVGEIDLVNVYFCDPGNLI